MDHKQKPLIMVVDDSEMFIDIVIEALGDDYRFCASTSGEDALEVVADEQPDLILLDILMPHMDGYQVCARLKANTSLCHIPVIFLTVKSEVDDEQKGFDVGAVDYISKPISLSILRARVRTHLDMSAARVALEQQNHALKEAARLQQDVSNMVQHDIKSPLVAVISGAQLFQLRHNALSERDKELLKNIENAGYHILQIINHSLDLYKIEQGLYRYEAVQLDLVVLMHKIIAEHGSVLQECDLHIKFHMPKDAQKETIWVQGEELLSYTMFNNLLQNAIEASPRGATIDIDFACEGHVSLGIRNDGVIPVPIRDRFFDKYVSMNKSGGTGLGAYSAKLFAEVQGAHIECQTLDEKATKITVYFPSLVS